MKWACGITTVPDRVDNLLSATIESLSRAGFYSPVVFTDIAYKPKASNGKGHLAHWMTSLFNLYVTNPKADRYALFEDDLLCCSNLYEYLDRCPYPDKGYWNLLTHDMNLVSTGGKPGWHPARNRGKGAVGLVFDKAALLALLTSSVFLGRPDNGDQCPDGLVIDTLKPQGYTEYIHCPSLIQHVGTSSTLGHKYGKVLGFKGEEYNPLQLLEQPANV